MCSDAINDAPLQPVKADSYVPHTPPCQHCPHCHAPLTMAQVIEMMHGDGLEKLVRVRLSNGVFTFMEAGRVYPKVVTVLDDSERMSGPILFKAIGSAMEEW